MKNKKYHYSLKNKIKITNCIMDTIITEKKYYISYKPIKVIYKLI